ncbi:calmodulin-beta-like isoform X2 [Gigantopelta aegis]|uniref:calmodulin-beta-like isoform X2 n=1 Tax=Gigantopelta aegis TaxID=1735272 RepID=UPI001B889FA4|nr:calmodulin-beta-like isoform X2 [Gigantopelta aegis]
MSAQDHITEAFRLFDRDGDGMIPASEVGTVVRALGYIITEAELNSAMKKAGVSGRSGVNLATFRKIIEPLETSNYSKQLNEAFATIDREGSGVVRVAELRHLLTTLGDKLTDEEFDILLQEMDLDKGGEIRRTDFIHFMTSR